MIGGRKTPADPDEVEDELEQLEEEGDIVAAHHRQQEGNMAREPTEKAEPKAEPKQELPEDVESPRAGSINEPPGSNVLDRGPPPKPEVEPPASRRRDDDDDEDEDERGKGKKRR